MVVKLRELREGESFVTLLSRMEGLVIERHSDGVVVDLARGDLRSTRRLHPNVRVAVS